MSLHWPQIIFAALTLMQLGMALAKDGEPKGNWSFWWSAISASLVFWLLYEGGFWTVQ